MAGISTTQSFADGDTVTAAKLNNIIANAYIDDDAVTTAKIDNNAVELAQMANNSVDTDQLVNDAVQNSKLETMAAKTVKANATNATANPTDVAVAANELLVGTTNSINAVSFSDDLALDNADSTASKITAAPGLINGKSTVAAATDVHDDDDRLLICDADGVSSSVASLKQIAPKKLIQSLPATTAGTGVLRVASGAAVTDPYNATVVEDALTPTQAINCPIFAKAVLEATTTLDGDASTTNSPLNINSVYNFGTQLTSGTLTSSTTYYIYKYASGDDFTNVGAASNATGVNFTATSTTPATWSNGSIIIAAPLVASQGVINVVFSDALPHNRYMVMATANYDNSTGSIWENTANFKAESKTTSGFTIKIGSYDSGQGALRNPRNLQIIVF